MFGPRKCMDMHCGEEIPSVISGQFSPIGLLSNVWIGFVDGAYRVSDEKATSLRTRGVLFGLSNLKRMGKE